LAAGQLKNPKCSLMHPRHEWILPQEDLQRAPYVPPNELRMPEQRVPEQRVMLDNAEPTNNMLPQPLACITNAPPIMLAQTQQQDGTVFDKVNTFTKDTEQHTR
jgi:hypothetical protein